MTDLPTFRYRWRWDLPARPAALWPLVSDTDRFNMDTGLPPVEEVRDEELENARRRLRFSKMGLRVEWEEQPFEWIRPHRFGVVRRYSRGPLEEMRVRVRLEALEGERTRLTYDVEARPSGLVGMVAIPLGIGLVSRFTFGRAFRRYAREVADEDPSGGGSVDGGDSGARNSTDLVGWLEDHDVPSDVARSLTAHLDGADDLSVARLRPYALADVWNLPRTRTLKGFLLATRAGVLDLRWDLLCPLCRGPKESASTLSQLRTSGVHCETCRIDFGADMERSVELVFTPNPRVREIDAPAFCVAGPQITPHIVVQQLLDASEERTVRPELEPGRYRVRGLERGRAVRFRVRGDDDEGELLLQMTEEGVVRSSDEAGGAESTVGPRPELVLRNRSDGERLAVVERTAWADDAVTGAEVTALQEFRDLFSGEVLASGEFLSVGSLAVLFTDLRGSTRLYRELGDGPAFGRVMDHFEVLREAVGSNDGAVVKTIGDAVMAVFREPARAVRAAVAAHRNLESPLVLKAGIHFGPCFVIRANERLDYFGTTVNVAARLQDASRGGEVVVSDRVRQDDGVAGVLEDEALEVTSAGRSEGSLSSLEDLDVRRWRIAVGTCH